MTTRVPVARWRRPTSRALEGIYPSGRPPFDPFPTVTTLVSAAFCPVSIYHRFLHGISQDVTSSSSWQLRGAGNISHEFIAFLKSLKAIGKPFPTRTEAIRHEFILFARTADPRTRELCWAHYLEPWIHRKFGELIAIEEEARLFFEITAAHVYVQFAYNGGVHTYPLTGVIDEIDIDQRRIIERTIKGKTDDDNPPLLKDYQLWLLWKILNSVKASERPKQLKDVDFSDFDLIVETPYQDFRVRKKNPEFERQTHEAYAWIHDVSFDKRVGWEVYQHRRCTSVNRVEECGLKRWCYRRRPSYPESRPEMSRVFKGIYRPLFWEQIWDRHLFQYRLLMLPSSTLELMGLMSKGKMVSFSDGRIEVEVRGDQADSISARRFEGARNYVILPFGNLFIGKRIRATFGERDKNRLILDVMKKEIPTSETVLILPIKADLPILEDRPWYLTRVIQNDMFTLEYIGTSDQTRASGDSVVQLIESLFGQKALRREGVDR